MSVSTDSSNQFLHTFATDDTCAIREGIVVLKIGSSSISNNDGTVQLSTLSRIVEIVHALRAANYKPILVSSGAVSIGTSQMNLASRPTDVIGKQTAAAVGQGHLMRLWSDLFAIYNITVAQVLLTRDNISHELHYLNAMNTIQNLLTSDVVPIINENDSLSVLELKIGDNDSLSSMVASMLKAKWLFLLTDVDALYSANPKTDPTAYPIRVVDDIDALIEHHKETSDEVSATGKPCVSGKWGTGGMITKLYAARLASYAGVTTAIISSTRLEDVQTILSGNRETGTVFAPSEVILTGREKFIMIGIVPSGTLYVTHQAACAITKHISANPDGTTISATALKMQPLTPAQIHFVTGEFNSFECVSLVVASPNWLLEHVPEYSKSIAIKTAETAACADAEIDQNEASPKGEQVSQLTQSLLETIPSESAIPDGIEVARGLTNFSSSELKRVIGLATNAQIFEALGYHASKVVIDQSNLAIHHKATPQ